MSERIEGDWEGKVSFSEYTAMYQESIADPEAFWSKQAEKYVTWHRPWNRVLSGDFKNNDVSWFEGAKLNACYNCIDRHLPERANQMALIWEGNEPSESQTFSYRDLYEKVCRLANGLKSIGVKKGDRVCIYMPMIPEAIFSMLACARIGAIHSVVFAGFSPEALKNRIQDAQCSVVITADANVRGKKILPLKANVDVIIYDCPSVHSVVVVPFYQEPIKINEKDINYDDLVLRQDIDCPVEMMSAQDPLFILYTSGSTGKPKGVLHGHAGYLLYATMTFQLVFNYQENEVYWCTADIGWITGHSYIVYGPLASGATTLIFAGVPTYPTPSRYWEVVDKHQVTIFYTAPTAIRALIRAEDEAVTRTSRKSLKLLGTVGEPINPDVWLWYFNVVGEKRCPIVDTWWQTETGGIMMTCLPGAGPLKPGSAGHPFFGVEFALIDDQGNYLSGKASGNLVITKPWPGQLQTVYNDPKRYHDAYFSQFPEVYCTGDDASRDEDGFYWIIGRSDDVINVSGHRLDTAEIESAIVSHPDIAEAAVVGCPHPIKGQGIFAFVTPKSNIPMDEKLSDVLKQKVREKIGAIAIPDHIEWTADLPKTRSGKIMRRILRKIVYKESEKLGDISTLSNPEVVDALVQKSQTWDLDTL